MSDDLFSPGLGSLAAQQPQQPSQPSGFWFGNTPQWLDDLGSSLSNLAGGNPQDYLGAISLAKLGRPNPLGVQSFHMMNEQGQNVGKLEAHMAEPDLLKIDWQGSVGGSNSLGFANSRSVLPELLREFPNMKRYTASRVTGARYGPAASYKGSSFASDLPGYMSPVYNVPKHIKANPPNQWSGKWLHEDSGKWYGDNEGPIERQVPIRTQESGTGFNEEMNRIDQRFNEDMNRIRQGFVESMNRISQPPAPPAPQPQVTSPMAAQQGFNPTRFGIPTQQQTPGQFTAQQMGSFSQQPMNLQILSDQLQQMRGGGGAPMTEQRMELE